MQPRLSRVEFLSNILETRGMHPTTANDLSCQLVVHHPLAGRLGIEGLARVIADRGLEQAPARDAALAMLAIEIFGRGAHFGAALEELQKFARVPGEALEAAIEGSRVVRVPRTADRARDTSKGQMVFALNLMGIASVMAAVLFAIIA